MQASLEGRPGCGLCRIELDHVSVRLDNEDLLSDCNLHIHCGELTVLIGPNGGGKTTLLRALLRQIPCEGEIRHLDQHDKPFPAMRTGYVPQQLPFDRQMPMTVRDLLAAALSQRPVWTGVGRRARQAILESLCLAQAEQLIDRRLGALSGGELQRVLLALALSPTPDLLILDEPVSGVDHNGQALFLDTVDALRRQRHLAILMVSHDWVLVREYADRVALIDKTTLAVGSAEEVFASAAFAAAFPHSHGTGRAH
ncbi:MAG: metal ABC transporter ATP-binding protein [Christensenellales bacterium]